MKRITKNIIHFSIVGLMLILIMAPLILDKPPDMNNRNGGQPGMKQSQNSAPPQKPSDNSNSTSKNNDNSTLNSNSSNNSSNSKSNNNSSSQNKSNDTANSNNMLSNENGDTPPEKPDGEEPPEMQNGQNGGQQGQNGPGMGMQKPGSNMAGIEIFDTIISIVEFLILNIFLVYLIMSRANKYNFKETFSTTSRKLIYGISVLVISVVGFVLINIPFGAPSGSPEQIPGQMPGQMGSQNLNQSNVEYNAEKTINSNLDEESKNYSSDTENKLAVLVTDSITANLNRFKLYKTGSANEGGDNTSFYGTNAGILAKNSAKLNINGAEINTDAKGANGVFSFGGSLKNNSNDTDGTTVNISDSNISTKQDDSGGVMTTGGGIMNIYNCIINTLGRSSAAIRTDRGGGNVNVDRGTYTTSGMGSPAIYSTANVAVKNAELNSNTSEGVVIEGKNKVSLDNCKLTDNNNSLNGQSTTYKNVFLYQSMSGDSDEGTSEFSATNSEINTNNGDSFYVTNTKAIINLENNQINNSDADGNLLRIQKDSWGKDGNNGGQVTFNLSNQNATGNIVVDSISSLTMNLKNNSFWEGTISGDNISLNLDSNSIIKLTDDCHVKSLTTVNGDYSNIDFNGHKIYVDGNEISANKLLY